MIQSTLRRWVKRRLTLSEQFFLISFVILLGGMLLMGWWVANRIETVVIDQTANITALYMKSFVAPLLQPLTTHDTLESAQHQELQRLVFNTPLGQDIVSLKVWSPEGKVLFSLEPSLIGSQSTPDENLRVALGGQIVSHLTTRDKPENVSEQRFSTALIETYVPVHETGTDRIIAVAEFLQYSQPLLQQIAVAQQQSWLVVTVATMFMYALLSGLVAKGSHTIERQQTQLQQSVKDLEALLDENRRLQHSLQVAGARVTEINEQFLHRIGHDLHDGPAQDLALALLRLDEVCQANPAHLETIRHALRSALYEIRTLAAGLQLPELENLSIVEVARRAIREFQRKTNAAVSFEATEAQPSVSLSKKIAVYRVITEGLHNSYRHAGANNLRVQLVADNQQINIEINDNGPGFDLAALHANGDHLGIAGLQQRIALLAGIFNIESSHHTGTHIQVKIPLKEG